MRAYVKKLQSKSENTRKQILVGSLIVSMSFVCFIWIGSLGYKFNNTENTAKSEDVIKPFALFGQTISDTYNNVTASVGNISLPLKKVELAVPEKVIELVPVEYPN